MGYGDDAREITFCEATIKVAPDNCTRDCGGNKNCGKDHDRAEECECGWGHSGCVMHNLNSGYDINETNCGLCHNCRRNPFSKSKCRTRGNILGTTLVGGGKRRLVNQQENTCPRCWNERDQGGHAADAGANESGEVVPDSQDPNAHVPDSQDPSSHGAAPPASLCQVGILPRV